MQITFYGWKVREKLYAGRWVFSMQNSNKVKLNDSSFLSGQVRLLPDTERKNCCSQTLTIKPNDMLKKAVAIVIQWKL